MSGGPDCICDGRAPWCAPCTVSIAFQLRVEHEDSLSVSMLKRRMGRSITGHEAALLVEATKRMLTDSVAHAARRNGRR